MVLAPETCPFSLLGDSKILLFWIIFRWLATSLETEMLQNEFVRDKLATDPKVLHGEAEFGGEEGRSSGDQAEKSSCKT